MNSSSGCDINLNHDPFSNNHEVELLHQEHVLPSEKSEHSIKFKPTSHLDEDISDFVFHRLVEISDQMILERDWDRRNRLVKMADAIVKEYEIKHQQRGLIEKMINGVLVEFNIRHSEQEIRVLHRAIKTPSLGSKISPHIAPRLIQEHRNPQVNLESYDKVALVNVFFEKRYKELLTQNQQALKGLQEPQLSIFKARLKEEAIREIYNQELPKRIQEGYYNPAIIPREIDRILGPKQKIPRLIHSDAVLKELLETEVEHYAKYLSKFQIDYIKHDVNEAARLYLRAYPNKTHRNAFVLARDLIRFAVYQEIFDKGSFTGSDHGSKHIHHNIENADSLLKNMEEHADYSDKDRFIEHLIHFYHDIGYTVGLAGKSFACCKDHPLIGAKMIEENREYFEHYLDKESVNILLNGVLLHAIAVPDLSPDKTKINGMYPNMIRAVVSISDACAVTYDRKTQEFWEQSSTLISLIRLRLFLSKYPQYVNKLAHSGQDEWYQLNKDHPMDVLAHDIFQNTKRLLLKAVDQFEISPEKKGLFRQAILQQFNSFTTSITLGQYGAVLTGVSAIKNMTLGDGAPKFLPQFDMAPSIVYGTIHDLFGEDLAQASFKKLVDEFSGDLKALAKEINSVALVATQHGITKEKVIKTGNAYFKIHNNDKINLDNEHFSAIQFALHAVVKRVDSIYQGKLPSLIGTNTIVQELQAFRNGTSKKCSSFSEFVMEFILPNIRLHQSTDNIHDIHVLTKVVKEDMFDEIRQADNIWLSMFKPLQEPTFFSITGEVDRFRNELEKLKGNLAEPKAIAKFTELKEALISAARQNGLDSDRLNSVLNEINNKALANAILFKKAELRYLAIENAVKLALVSDEEYRFMRGKNPTVSKSDCLVQLINKQEV